jgi:hypothetical protein
LSEDKPDHAIGLEEIVDFIGAFGEELADEENIFDYGHAREPPFLLEVIHEGLLEGMPGNFYRTGRLGHGDAFLTQVAQEDIQAISFTMPMA